VRLHLGSYLVRYFVASDITAGLVETSQLCMKSLADITFMLLRLRSALETSVISYHLYCNLLGNERCIDITYFLVMASQCIEHDCKLTTDEAVSDEHHYFRPFYQAAVMLKTL